MFQPLVPSSSKIFIHRRKKEGKYWW